LRHATRRDAIHGASRAPACPRTPRRRPRARGRADGANTNSINRLCRSTDGELLVTSDDASHLKLFNHPCIVEDAPFSGPFFAHASHVPAAVFLRGDEHVASAGGSDRTVMLWRVVRTGGEREPDAFGAAPPRRNDPPPANKWRPNGRT
jgi:hypothetical protein